MGSTLNPPEINGWSSIAQQVTVPSGGCSASGSTRARTNRNSATAPIRLAGRLSAQLQRLDPHDVLQDRQHTNGWVNYKVNLSAYAGQNDYIYFGCYGDGYKRRTSISMSTTLRSRTAARRRLRRRRRRHRRRRSRRLRRRRRRRRARPPTPTPDAHADADGHADRDAGANPDAQRRLQRRGGGQRTAYELERHACNRCCQAV